MVSEPIHKVAICGSGIGGLTLAAVLSKYSNIHVDIYEAKPVVSTTGAAIAIWKRSWQVLQDLGLDDEMVKRNLPLPKDGEGKLLLHDLPRKIELNDAPTIQSEVLSIARQDNQKKDGPTAVTRPHLLDMLQALLDPGRCKIYTSKRLTTYQTSDSGVTLVFADGSTATADVLVGSDGVHSLTRATMYRSLSEANPQAGYEKLIEPIWSGTHAYRCSVNLPNFRALYPNHQALIHPKIWCGKNKHVVSHPLGSIINLVCYFSVETGEGTPYDGAWVTDVPPEEVINAYEGWEPDLLQLLKHLEKPSRWTIHVVRPLPLSVSGRVALLGDAAHAMTPHQGVGGGQAIEDGHILGHLLAHPQAQLNNVEEILRVYQEVRLPLTNKAAERSRSNGWMYEFIHPDYPIKEGATAEDLAVLGKAIGDSFGWLAQGGCDEDLSKAEGLFLARLLLPTQ